MQTALTIDDDVAAQLERLRARRRTSFKALVNEALRRGVEQLTAPPPAKGAHSTPSRDLGRCLVGSIDDVSEVLAVAEGESSDEAVDANILVYAHVSGFAQHDAARHGSMPGSTASIASACRGRACSRFRPACHQPAGLRQAREHQGCLEPGRTVALMPRGMDPSAYRKAPGFPGTLPRDHGPSLNHVPDADLAALALEHGLALCSTDSDFARFAGLRWENPIA